MMNILFRGGGFSNKGDEAMMLTVQRELSKRLPGANFLLATTARGLDEAHASGLFAYASSGGWLRRGVHLMSACVRNRDVRQALRLDWVTAEAMSNLGGVDCVIDLSGYNYSDEWGITCANRGLAWAIYCDRNEKPFICLPQAWGPFRKQHVAEATRQLCKFSSVVCARDKVSLSFLKGLLGQDDGRVRMAPDIAFLFSGDRSDVGRAALASLGVKVGSSPVIGMAPNWQVYKRCRGVGAANEYIQMLVRVAEHCIHAWDVSIVLLPHAFSMSGVAGPDDRFLCGLVKAGVSNPERCSTIRTYVPACFLKAVESQLDFMIGSRFHSCVFALSSGVPAVALGWTHKYAELMEVVGLDGDSLIHTQFDEENVMEILDRAWERRAESAAKIKEHLPGIREQVTSLFDDVADVLRPSNVSAGNLHGTGAKGRAK